MIEPIIRCCSASDGYQLHFRHWRASSGTSGGGERACRGLIVGLHGIQSHSGWYQYSSQRLAAAGFDVYFADRRGSGLNGQDRGHADHGQRLINDVRQLIRLARREHSGAAGVPVTLIALSWGGKIGAALAATAANDIDRLALLYPGLQPKLRPGWFQTLQLNAARDFDIRRRIVPIPLTDPALFTETKQWQQFIAKDQLALHAVTSGFLNAGRDLDAMLRQHAANIHHPVLTMLAGRDRIIDNQATRQQLCTFGTKRLKVIEYLRSCHTLEFDEHPDEFIDDLLAWLTTS